MGVSAIGRLPAEVGVPNPSLSPQTQIISYTLKKGETLYGIAKQYGVSFEYLLKFNNIKKEDVTKLPIGMVIRIPASLVKLKRNNPPKTAIQPAVTQPQAKAEASVGAKSVISAKQAGNYADFKEAIGQKESTGKYNVMNRQGNLGKYQLGKDALVEIGLYKKTKGEFQNKDYAGTFTGKYGVNSVEDFLNNPDAQEKAVKAYHKILWEQIKAKGMDKSVGETISYKDGTKTDNVTVTKSGLIAGAYLVGAGALKSFLRFKGSYVPKDGNGIPITEYMKKFGGYNVDEITK